MFSEKRNKKQNNVIYRKDAVRHPFMPSGILRKFPRGFHGMKGNAEKVRRHNGYGITEGIHGGR